MPDFSNILLTVDYDRTLTGPDSSIPERNLEAIRYFMENGGAFTVNTGRSIPMAARNTIPKVPVNAPLLLYNGSAAYDKQTGQLEHCIPIDLDPMEVLYDIQNRFPELNIEIQGRDAHYLLRQDSGWERFNDTNGCAWAYERPDRIPGPFLKFAIYGSFRGASMSTMYEYIPWEQAMFRQAADYIRDTYGDKVDLCFACARILDVQAKGVSKSRAAKALQQRLGRKMLVCVGDAENDIPMLEAADYAYCPADGVVADRFENVCPCGEGAVADVIYKKLPALLK